MRVKTLVSESTIAETAGRMPSEAFTVLDFIEVFRSLFPEDWRKLVDRFGLLGSKRKYTVATYFSNRLDVYSQKPYSVLVPFTRYSQGKFRGYRRTTEKERKVFGSPWVAVFRKNLERARP